MFVEYRILFNYDTREGTITFSQDGAEIESTPIRQVHISQSQTIDYVKDENQKIVSAHHIGPKMTTLTMTGVSD